MAEAKSIWPTLDRCDHDPYRLLSQGLATIVRIAQQREDNKHALEAGKWLVAYGEQLLAEKKAQAGIQAGKRSPSEPSTRAEIMAELKGLYARALGPGEPLVVTAEAVNEPTASPAANHDR